MNHRCFAPDTDSVEVPKNKESVIWVTRKVCVHSRISGIDGVWILDIIFPYSRNSGIGIRSHRNSVEGPENLDPVDWVLQKFCETSR
jgi:hypothetical protein